MTPTTEQIRSAIAEQAADWFVANRTGELADEERRAFIAWLRMSPVHVEEYLATASLARDLPGAMPSTVIPAEALVAEARAATDKVASIATPRATARRAGRHRLWSEWLQPLGAAAAAAAVLVIAIGILWVGRHDWLGVPVEYATARGERASWQLPDGSSLQLDGDSAATLRYRLDERRVELVRGRALFAVAHGSRRPFRVVAGPARVVAVGTQFDVDRHAAATLVTVIEGRVLVAASDAPAGVHGEAGSVALTAGQQARVVAGAAPTLIAAADLRLAQAWLRGKIAFDRRGLGEVAEEFNRYAAVPFEIADPALRELAITGVFDDDDSESFVRFLQSLDAVVVERTPDRVRVLRASQPPHGTGPARH